MSGSSRGTGHKTAVFQLEAGTGRRFGFCSKTTAYRIVVSSGKDKR
jgi:hypothetical protein